MAEQFHQLRIDANSQTLTALGRAGEVMAKYDVSTGKNGLGEKNGSECTPRGEHVIHAKIGAGAVANAVFVGRQATGEVYQFSMREKFPERDWILTRILWLGGIEPGKNCQGDVDTQQRYIYFHGSPDDVAMGVPGSRGCVRMRNADIIELFERVEVGTPVFIS